MVEDQSNGATGIAPLRKSTVREIRREQLIDATIRSVAKLGIANTTMSSITEIAGLSVGLVNFHFESKQKLFQETLLFLAREHEEHWRRAHRRAGLSAADRLLAIADAHFDRRICKRRKLAVWYAFFGAAGRRSEYRDLIDEFDNERLAVSADLCDAIIAEGGYCSIPADVIARTLEGLYDGLWLNILMAPDQFDRHLGRQQVRAYLHAVFPAHFTVPVFQN
ncbi:TetR family transcriptional regulator C-terminal domain-containing protein [uncultured Roseobacter sp.]|uniref:TetR family transcriptional regulator C-terminal domain-containing protein n=1 Tax=uncultured Roseobacter sp. TaxID=114847 RepID=UPI00262BF2A7|nr:TetR family transcriptional regulator C-terminal domain-containing protein [uncultured Roseobacter sp.]